MWPPTHFLRVERSSKRVHQRVRGFGRFGWTVPFHTKKKFTIAKSESQSRVGLLDCKTSKGFFQSFAS